MSVKRYTNGADDDQGTILPFMEESPNGDYVEYSDYAALLAATQWRPIETAPKDGTHILGLLEDGEVERIHWYKYPTHSCWETSYFESEITPTHWMPLPKPPCV